MKKQFQTLQHSDSDRSKEDDDNNEEESDSSEEEEKVAPKPQPSRQKEVRPLCSLIYSQTIDLI